MQDYSELQKQIDSLNPQQRAAVYANVHTPVLVHAGAGTGKTKVSNCRIGRLIQENIAEPDRILSVTFTRKAAQETRERLTAYVGSDLAKQVHIGNFHSIGVKMLRAMPSVAGFPHDQFTVIDEEEQFSVLATVAWDHGKIQERPNNERGGSSYTYLRNIFNQIQSWKERGITYRMAETTYKNAPHLRDALTLYRAYQETLRTRITCDYADLLLLPLDAMRTDPQIRNHWADQFQYIQVDEYQDTNTLQLLWLHMLADKHQHIFAVGDPDQSMYRWRGARPEMMYKFKEEWPNALILPLEQNYRSTQEILDPANKIVATPGINIKTLNSAKRGNIPQYTQYDTEHAEANAIAQSIQQKIESGERVSEIAILLRMHSLFGPYEQALRALNIPYESARQQDFMQRDEVKDILSLLRLTSNPADEQAFLRISHRVGHNIHDNEAWYIINQARAMGTNTPLYDACISVVNSGHIPQAYIPAIEYMAKQLHQLYTIANKHNDNIEQCIGKILDITQYFDPEIHTISDEQEDTIRELTQLGENFTNISEYLDHINIHAIRQNRRVHGVSIMTVHAAKGLEFNIVYAPCTEEKILPNSMALRAPDGLQEERNIAHVLWTRARNELYISSARVRSHSVRQPSRFLLESGIVESLPREAKKQKNEEKVIPAYKKIALQPIKIAWGRNPFSMAPPRDTRDPNNIPDA